MPQLSEHSPIAFASQALQMAFEPLSLFVTEAEPLRDTAVSTAELRAVMTWLRSDLAAKELEQVEGVFHILDDAEKELVLRTLRSSLGQATRKRLAVLSHEELFALRSQLSPQTAQRALFLAGALCALEPIRVWREACDAEDEADEEEEEADEETAALDPAETAFNIFLDLHEELEPLGAAAQILAADQMLFHSEKMFQVIDAMAQSAAAFFSMSTAVSLRMASGVAETKAFVADGELVKGAKAAAELAHWCRAADRAIVLRDASHLEKTLHWARSQVSSFFGPVCAEARSRTEDMTPWPLPGDGGALEQLLTGPDFDQLLVLMRCLDILKASARSLGFFGAYHQAQAAVVTQVTSFAGAMVRYSRTLEGEERRSALRVVRSCATLLEDLGEADTGEVWRRLAVTSAA